MFRTVCIAILLALPNLASAGVKTELTAIEKRLGACTEKNPSNLELNQCTARADEAADKVLNRVYASFADRLKHGSPDDAVDNKEKLKRLIASERAWIAFRDAECQLRGTQMLGGSGEGLVVGDCLYTMTKDRAKSLDELASDN